MQSPTREWGGEYLTATSSLRTFEVTEVQLHFYKRPV